MSDLAPGLKPPAHPQPDCIVFESKFKDGTKVITIVSCRIWETMVKWCNEKEKRKNMAKKKKKPCK